MSKPTRTGRGPPLTRLKSPFESALLLKEESGKPVPQNLSVEARTAMQEQEKNDRPKVKVDEDWKKAVAEDKARARTQDSAGTGGTRPHPHLPEPSIQLFMAGLYGQTLVLLGEMENPATGQKEEDIDEAAYMVDTIAMLKQKMEGNLTPEEGAYVQTILTDLRMRYVRAAQGTEQNRPAPEDPATP